MRWLSRLKRQPRTARATGVDGSFQRLEWRAYFEGLTPEQRRESSLRLCEALVARAPIAGEEVEQAMRGLLTGLMSPELVSDMRSVVDRLEGEYDAILGDDGDDCSDPRLNEAFVRARTGTALHNALSGDYEGMAYEAWFVLDDLDQIRSLVGIPTHGQQTASSG
jgi:hypothetical protein